MGKLPMSMGKLFQNHSTNCYQDQNMEHSSMLDICPVSLSIISALKENHYLTVLTIKLS